MTISVSAQIRTDRPNISVGASTIASGKLQLEMGYQLSVDDATGNNIEQQIPNALVRLGLSKVFELRMAMSYNILRYVHNFKFRGFSNFELGTKISLLNKKKNALAYYLDFYTPTGTDNVSSRIWGIDSRFNYELAVGPYAGINANLGYTAFDNNSNGNLIWTLAYTYQFNKKVSFYVEPYGSFVEMENWSFSADAGVMFLLSPRSQFDFYFGTGLTEEESFMGIGFSTLTKGSPRKRNKLLDPPK